MSWAKTIVALVLLACSASGQKERVLETKVLPLGSARKIDAPSFGYWAPAACDGDGNLYFHADTGEFRHPGVLMLTRAGSGGQLFQLSGEYADTNRFSFENFSVTRDGTVELLLGGEGKNYLAEFDDSGSTKFVVALSTPEKMVATDLIALEGNNVLVVGYFEENASSALRGKRYVGVLQTSGRLVKELTGTLPDVDLKTFASKVQEGDVVSADDGLLYFLGSDNILVTSMLGQINRKIRYRKPDPKSLATKLYVSGGMGIVDLDTWKDNSLKDRRFLTLDLSTGEPTGLYTVPSLEEVGMDVCFDRKEGLIFLHHDGNKQTLNTALLR